MNCCGPHDQRLVSTVQCYSENSPNTICEFSTNFTKHWKPHSTKQTLYPQCEAILNPLN